MASAVPRNRRAMRAALRALGARPSKRLGQNFLADARVLRRIVEAAAPGPGDRVLEVGPGLGVLTERLAATGAAVLAVEIDPVLARFLSEALAAEPRVRVLAADALDGSGGLSGELRGALEDLDGEGTGRFLVVANLPYSVATPLVQSLLLREPAPADMVVMVQREVADRLRAAPGTREYGPLTVLVRSLARVAPVLSVPKEAFHPVPAVASSVLRVTPDAGLRAAAGDLAALRTLVHAAFALRRKTLGNALAKAGLCTPGQLAALGVDPRRRGETLTTGEFAALARGLASLASAGRPVEDRPSPP